MRAMHVTEDITRVDGTSYVATPPGVLDDIVSFLTRASSVIDPFGATVLLDEQTHVRLGFPEKFPSRLVTKHPTLDAARQAGWHVSDISPWMTFWRSDGKPSINVGILPWLSRDNFTLLEPNNPAVTLIRMVKFHEWIGIPYHGSSGGPAGITLLRDHHRGMTPMWMPRNFDKIPPAGGATETLPQWTAANPPGCRYEHTYDANVQFLAAAGNANLAVNQLRMENRPTANRVNLPGYYLVTVPPWHLEDRIPHPIGNHKPGTQVWITGATLDLVYQVADDYSGIVDIPEVHQAWTAPGGRVLREWASTIHGAVKAAQAHGDSPLVEATKDAYKVAIGLLKRRGGRIYRPDWHHTVIALARSNAWRKIWKEWVTSERHPVKISFDAITYPSNQVDPHDAWPMSFPRHDGPGGFTWESTQKVIA